MFLIIQRPHLCYSFVLVFKELAAGPLIKACSISPHIAAAPLYKVSNRWRPTLLESLAMFLNIQRPPLYYRFVLVFKEVAADPLIKACTISPLIAAALLY